MMELSRVFVDVTRYHRYMTHSAMCKIGLGRGMPPVLDYVIRNDGCKQSDISREVHMTPATAMVMLQTLEKNGFITRRSDKNDQRCMRIYITDEGRAVAKLGKETLDGFDGQFFGALTAEEQEALTGLLKKLWSSVEENVEKYKISGKENRNETVSEIS